MKNFLLTLILVFCSSSNMIYANNLDNEDLKLPLPMPYKGVLIDKNTLDKFVESAINNHPDVSTEAVIVIEVGATTFHFKLYYQILVVKIFVVVVVIPTSLVPTASMTGVETVPAMFVSP